MMENPNNQGKSYCKKCLTWFENSHKVCPFCGAPNESLKAIIPVIVTKTVDQNIAALLGALSEDQKIAVLELIKTLSQPHQ